MNFNDSDLGEYLPSIYVYIAEVLVNMTIFQILKKKLARKDKWTKDRMSGWTDEPWSCGRIKIYSNKINKLLKEFSLFDSRYLFNPLKCCIHLLGLEIQLDVDIAEPFGLIKTFLFGIYHLQRFLVHAFKIKEPVIRDFIGEELQARDFYFFFFFKLYYGQTIPSIILVVFVLWLTFF